MKREDIFSVHEDKDDIIQDQLDVTKKLIDVHDHKLKKTASSDIVLASFQEEKDKKYIIELAYSANYAITAMLEHLTNWDKYYENNPLAVKKLIERTGKEYKEIRKLCVHEISETYALFMSRINWLALLNRNVKDNPLIKDILNSTREAIAEQEEEGLSKEMKSIKKQLQNQEKKKEE